MDIVDVADISGALGSFGERYLHRIASDRERRSWPPAGEGLLRQAAGAFAAKEAVLKVLGCDAGTVHWPDIELLQLGPGERSVTLHEDAAVLAARAGIREINVSVATTRGIAAATALATTSGKA